MTTQIDNLIDTVICGNVFDKLPEIATGTVHCVVTSPPYWGLRDYGVDGQLGLEKTPEEYIAKMVTVFREVWRVLRDDGTLWLNLGDSYSNNDKWGGTSGGKNKHSADGNYPRTRKSNRRDKASVSPAGGGVTGLKPKDLCGIPWRVALALQADGWYLRQDIIWHKPNPMPESVTDRCTKAHEYIFLMTKKPRYYYDAEAIKEESSPGTHERLARGVSETHKNVNGAPGQTPHSMNKPRLNRKFDPSAGNKNNPSFDAAMAVMPATRNKRSVWTVPTAPYKEAHFATFPPKLIEPCILAGCPEWVCKKCGEPRRRITETTQIKRRRKTPTTRPCDDRSPSANDVAGIESKTTGWTDCGCNTGFDGGIVLDPFGGAFTTALVAYQNNRHYTIIELSKEYIRLGKARLEAEKDKYALFPE